MSVIKQAWFGWMKSAGLLTTSWLLSRNSLFSSFSGSRCYANAASGGLLGFSDI